MTILEGTMSNTADWTVTGTTNLTDNTFVSNKKLKTVATSSDYKDLVNVPAPAIISDINSSVQPPRSLKSRIEGGYEVTASSENPSYSTHRAFGRSDLPLNGNDRWVSQRIYDATTGAYTGTNTTSTNIGNVAGEWIQIKLPAAYKATSWFWNFQYVIATMNMTLCGSNDGVNFIRLQTVTYSSRNAPISIPNPGDYIYYRVIVTANDRYPDTSLTQVYLSNATTGILSDWNATSGAAQILNKPAVVNADWNAISGAAQILNKPPDARVFCAVSGTGAVPLNGSVIVNARKTDGGVTSNGVFTVPIQGWWHLSCMWQPIDGYGYRSMGLYINSNPDGWTPNMWVCNDESQRHSVTYSGLRFLGLNDVIYMGLIGTNVAVQTNTGTFSGFFVSR